MEPRRARLWRERLLDARAALVTLIVSVTVFLVFPAP